MIALRILAGLAGVALVFGTMLSAMRTVVVPRAEQARITSLVFSSTRMVFNLIARKQASYPARDRVMSVYAPTALLVLPAVWMTLVLLGFALLYWGLGQGGPWSAFELSGSSLLTLGFITPESRLITVVVFAQAILSMSILALLLITYLPSMYAAFSRREQSVTMLEVRAGSPPSGAEFLSRQARIHGLAGLDFLWHDWHVWFADVQESHASLPALVFFRSPHQDHSWVTAAGAVLDAASMFIACVDFEQVTPDDDEIRQPTAEICVRAGYLTLRAVADYFNIDYPPDPAPGDAISISRDEFDDVMARLAEDGVPLVDDLDAAWHAFAGWRVNYDHALIALADLVMAPYAPWSSDRTIAIGTRS